jgi:4-carboxymuconolactone decarboxylase
MTEPRLHPLTAEERTPEQQRLIDRAGGELRVFTTLARHPELFDDFQHLGGRLLHRSALTEREREILILRTASGCRADYEWAQHHRIATALGLQADVIAALGQEAPDLSVDDALLARAADELVGEHHLSDETWQALSERFDEVQLIELCMLVGSYAMLAGTLNSMQVQPEPGLATPPWAQD